MTLSVMLTHGKEHIVCLCGILKKMEIEQESKCVILQITQYSN